MLFWMMLLVHHVLQEPTGCFACVEEERIALLDIKSVITDPFSSYTSWNKSSVDCCSWYGVHCSPTTKHVNRLVVTFAWESNRTLNVSLFHPFRELRSLILSSNDFNGCIPSDCFQSLAKLDNLRHLDLSSNKFYFINVSSATLKLSKLRYLDLSYNKLNESIVPYLVGLSSLKALYLSGNNMGGDLLLKGLGTLKNLEELSISENNLNGDIGLCLQNLLHLNYFDISYNQIRMPFPSTIIRNLTKLAYAFFSNNCFRGVISISDFANNTELKVLDFSNNNQLEVQFEHIGLMPSFQLDGIFLSNCIVNKGSSSIPMFLSTQYQIKYIDLSNNNLSGNIPTWLFQNKTDLLYLNLRNNSLTGPLIIPSRLKNLLWFDVSNNKLIGEIPVSIGYVIPSIGHLNMSDNFLQGVIPFSFKNLSQLNTLDLSNNRLCGQISNSIEYLDKLFVLDLAKNNFQGNMFKNNFNLTFLSSFIVNRNQLSGEIPSSICKMVELGTLDISENQLFGSLPNCMNNLIYLEVFHVGGNNLEGNIPSTFCGFQKLKSLDLSNNHFSGLVPSCFNLSSLLYLNLNDNNLTGPFPSAFFGNPLEVLDMGNNHFIGDIPNWIDTLQNLKIFSLKGNHFKGPIPEQICDLKYLRILDFSQNNLSEDIPPCVHNMGHNLASQYQFLEVVVIGIGGTIIPNVVKHFSSMPYDIALFWTSIVYIDFATKGRSYTYKGDIISYFSGLDLSCNKLVGRIPVDIGNMTWLQALNLSNNMLYGPIPNTLARLVEIESLDLSHNMLEGRIPSQLAELHFIESFSVAYNNLSGPTLGMVGQFSTFEEKSYEGNPYLCGPPLVKSCSNISSPQQNQVKDGHKNEETMEHLITIAIFVLGFIMGFWGWMALLFFKRSWRYSFFLGVDGYMEDIVDMARNLLAKIKSRL
ncbi:receptor like protein 21-like [Dioscorea cayenensis subsp. rotundata]|uniref:Receptor like protein 21-like n=1 Tax=Dioscorea cayennensis subsp. rotundata TaxID=55577 RepID=A0AB40AZ52_DIOCR|nr:receptor like protein 21-like [Dioscorea cayenensis subsp. rotundata]